MTCIHLAEDYQNNALYLILRMYLSPCGQIWLTDDSIFKMFDVQVLDFHVVKRYLSVEDGSGHRGHVELSQVLVSQVLKVFLDNLICLRTIRTLCSVQFRGEGSCATTRLTLQMCPSDHGS